MKYEITQGQYADFLNAVNDKAQSAHYPNKNANRLTIVNNVTPPTQYSADKSDRACNWLYWADVSAYLAWAALRPLTELEFEKACRGTDAVFPYQKAWGTTTGTLPSGSGISGVENGAETITTSGANINAGNLTFTSGDGGQGPLRVGIFATGSTTSRLQAGMSFYGAMDLSGNVQEYYVSSLAGTAAGTIYTGTLGNGDLNTGSGQQTVSGWPSATSPGNNIIRRGGSWITANGHTASSGIETNISYRGAGSTATGDNTSGGRGGR